MGTFNYIAVDGTGKETRGTIHAESVDQASETLKREGLFPTTLRAIADRESTGFRSRLSSSPGRGWFAPKLKSKVLCTFTRQLSTLLKAGLPLVRALRLLSRQYQDIGARKIIGDLIDSIENGMTLSDALARHPRTFNRLYISMVRAGEASGALEGVLGRQADYLEKRRRIIKRVKGALAYPATVFSVAVLITVALMIFIVPKFAVMFTGMLGDYPLPGITQFVIAISDLLIHRVYLALIAIAAVVIGFRLLRASSAGAYLLDRLLLKMPAFGNLLRLSASAQFCQTLGTLTQAGVSILNALKIVQNSCSNRVLSQAVDRIHEAVKEGETMSRTMDATRAFPTMLVGMVEVGEETGALPEMLCRVAESYEEEVDNAVDSLTSMIEPLMIVGLAGVIGTIVAALFMPLIVMISVIGNGG